MSACSTTSCTLSIFLLFSTLSSAQNYTSEFQGWIPEPDCDSGTASVIWECLTTIGLCTYVVVHVNISSIRLNGLASFIRKCIVVLVGLVLPEVWAWGAVSQLIEARNLVKDSKRLNHPITLKQAFFVYSGGIAIRNIQQCIPQAKAEDMLGKAVSVSSKSVWCRNWKLKLSDEEIVMFAKNVPSDDEIDDKSKQDTLVKIVTAVQVLWFAVQMAARGQQGLVITPMHFATLAYVAMAAFIYSCWWYKPYDVGVYRVLEGQTAATDGQFHADEKAWFAVEEHTAEPSRKLPAQGRRSFRSMPFINYPLEAVKHAGTASFQDIYQIIIIGSNRTMVLGALTSCFTAIHCAAWTYPFPTPVETLLWRVLTCGGILIGPWAFIENTRYSSGVWWRSGGKWWALGYIVYEVLWGVFSLLYLLSRLYVMTESFIAFRYAPKSVYEQIDWSAYVPHFGS